VKDGAVEVAVLRVLAEILAGDRRFLVEELDADIAVVGLDRDHDDSQ
jgi:hypothetical protein